MVACIKPALIFISREEIEKREKRELELVTECQVLPQPRLIDETRNQQQQYEDRLTELLEELDADCVQAPKKFIQGRDHTAIFYRDNKQRGKLDAYSGRI